MFAIVLNSQATDAGMYVARVFNGQGDAACAIKVQVNARQQQQQQQQQPVKTTVKSVKLDTSSKSKNLLPPETQALRILSEYRVQDRRPLPDLEPFPFKPDQTQAAKKKNRGKVPKPSKFVPGKKNTRH